jgi:two-component system response regulator TctD
MRILIVEDNAELAGLIVEGLRAAGYVTDRVMTAADARHVLAAVRYGAIILDLGLPDDDGLAVLRDLRSRKDAIPVLVLTARAGVHDRVAGLRAGADDYLIKPFAFEELLARLEALLRRPRQMIDTVLSVANLTFDTEGKQAFIDDEPQVLSARESAVLEILLRRKGRVVPKKTVEDQLFGLGGEGSANAVEVYVHRLRKQLVDGGATAQIHTIRGVGYMISEAK